jgi:hypothetical protein
VILDRALEAALEKVDRSGYAIAVPSWATRGNEWTLLFFLRELTKAEEARILREDIPCAGDVPDDCANRFERELTRNDAKVTAAVVPFARQVGRSAKGVRVARWAWPGAQGTARSAVSIMGTYSRHISGVIVFAEGFDPSMLLFLRSRMDRDEFGMYRAAVALSRKGQLAEARTAYREYLGAKYSRYTHLSYAARSVRLAVEQARFLLSLRQPTLAEQELDAVRMLLDELPVTSHERKSYDEVLAKTKSGAVR